MRFLKCQSTSNLSINKESMTCIALMLFYDYLKFASFFLPTPYMKFSRNKFVDYNKNLESGKNPIFLDKGVRPRNGFAKCVIAVFQRQPPNGNKYRDCDLSGNSLLRKFTHILYQKCYFWNTNITRILKLGATIGHTKLRTTVAEIPFDTT